MIEIYERTWWEKVEAVAAMRLEKKVEPIFHPDSYGYRPKRGALDAVSVCRRRCWEFDRVVEFDIRKFFDSVPWDLMVKAVEAHTHTPWVLLYVRRWLAAPIQQPDGMVPARDRGTPQGSAISPVLANLFIHYAFDAWLVREFPAVRFEGGQAPSEVLRPLGLGQHRPHRLVTRSGSALSGAIGTLVRADAKGCSHVKPLGPQSHGTCWADPAGR